MVLNMISTTAMVRLGYIYDNWMIGVAKTNDKLRKRALRNLREATGANERAAQRVLRGSDGDLRVALVMLKSGLHAQAARRLVAARHGNARLALRDALARTAH
jgi:N-acetylmuramic acid 6-phosphate etherase